MQGQAAGNPLTELGRRQASAAAGRLAGSGAVRLLSSDLERAAETAVIIGRRLGLAPEPTPALREQALGTLEGRLARDLVAEETPADAHVAEVRWGGGESLADVALRLDALCAALRVAPAAGPVVLVSHETTLQVLLARLAGRTHREVAFEPIANGAVLEALLL